MNRQIQMPRSLIVLLLGAALLGGCGGTKVLKEPRPMQATQPLAANADQRLRATLDWVIVRHGPGTWAKNADWDEYLLRVSNLSDQPIQITGLIVVDSLTTPIDSQPGRKKLVKGSKKTARRYKDSGLKVKAGRGAGTMLVAGAAVTAVGVSAASAVAYGSILSGTTAGSAGAAVGGVLLLGPVIAVGGVVRGVNNSAVNKQIESRQTQFPLGLPAMEEAALDVFFPLAPSPQRIELTYADDTGEHVLLIDTQTVLDGLHLDGAEASTHSV
ncbi:MAG: hypothetical protein HKP16_01505, partial [Xanthomonadales bacterium]|nr:hypothetical protein [Xanthomonadales bacterium]